MIQDLAMVRGGCSIGLSSSGEEILQDFCRTLKMTQKMTQL
jgi:hypothetical protein